MTATITPYRPEQSVGRDGFAQLLHAEWTKFRTVRGWVIGAVAAALVIVVLALLTANGSHASTCIGESPSNAVCTKGGPSILVGPGGEAVNDSFYVVHQPLTGDGSITARITSLTGLYPPNGAEPAGQGASAGMKPGLQPWTKAGLIVKQNTTQGSAYAAIMVTGSHGVRMQYNYTADIAGPTDTQAVVSAASPRWLRLTRTGDTFTGYESADGTHWTIVGTAHLAGLTATVQAGLFAASPDYTVTKTHLGGGGTSGGPTRATGVFDHVNLHGGSPGAAWSGTQVGGGGGPGALPGLGFQQTADTVMVTGSGDIAPVAGGAANGGGGQGIERTLIGAFAGLIVLIVLATLFITSEYRRGLIRITLAASPRRGRVLAAKAVIIGAVTLLAGLAAAAVAVPLGEHILRANGNAIYPVTTLTEVRVIVGTAALLAVVAVLALAVGTVLRRSAGAITLVVAAIVLPYILATAQVLPAGPSQWLLRLTPAAGFAIQQSFTQYPQVAAAYTPSNGYYPLAPWAGFAVLCGYTATALALAVYLIRRRDA
jgi:ABC-type transport system involved in multi-copper enzyme maturation permease subunit